MQLITLRLEFFNAFKKCLDFMSVLNAMKCDCNSIFLRYLY